MITRRTSNDLTRAEDVVRARGGRLGVPLVVLDETTSTNDEAKLGAKRGSPHGATWLAESQTAGRGRQGRAWLSPRGENLLFSTLLRTPCAPSRVPLAALVAGLAARDAIARSIGKSASDRVKVKWPNDVLVGEKKIAGVLCESAVAKGAIDYLVIGIGINVHTRVFPEEIGDIATSVACERGEDAPDADRAEIFADVLAALDRDVEHVLARGLGLVHERLVRCDAFRGTRVRGEEGDGIAEGIDAEGRLLVRGDDGIVRRWSSGEVTHAPGRK